VKYTIGQAALAAAALCTAGLASASNPATTQIQHVIVLFQENVSFDHYFGTYPNAQNNSGEQPFFPYPGTPTVNGLSPALLIANPNFNNPTTGSPTRVNPVRLTPAQAYTCSQNHSYGPEQQALDSGLMDKFPLYVGRNGTEGCATDGSTNLGYYDGNTVAAMWNYAQNYALNDNSFDATFGPSSPGAINLISGQTANATTHFGTTSSSSYPAAVGSGVTVLGDFDPYLDDCGADAGGTITTTTTLEMNHDATASTGNKNVGDLLNAAGVTWGWFQGGFRPAAPWNGTNPVVCSASRTEHEYPSGSPTVIVPNPVAPLKTGADIHTATADYVPHHEPFQFYASTRNTHHIAPSSPTLVGTSADGANHQYDTQDFFAALQNNNLPAVSFIKAPAAYNAHPGNSDPTTEQYWLTQVINTVMQSQFWSSTAIIIAYDDSDGWYDHVMGPIISPSDIPSGGATYDNIQPTTAGNGTCGTPLSSGAPLGRCGHGPRLPLLVISPFAQSNFVDHTLTVQPSILAFIEQNWSLGYIDGPTAPAAGTGSFDRTAGTLMNMFNFNNPPNTTPFLLSCSGVVVNAPAQACALDPDLKPKKGKTT
jgi:phospholipase C